MDDAYPLKGLTTYPELNGLSWQQLDPRFRDHIENRTLRCITILKDTHPQIKFDVFERLNTGSVKLNAQELRHGLNHGLLMLKLDELTKEDQWKSIVSIRQDKRMRSAELVLRYFAFRHDGDNYAKPLAGFLDGFSTKNKNISEKKLSEWSKDFREVAHRVERSLGDLAFKTYGKDCKPTGAFNAALFDAEMMGFSQTKNKKILDGVLTRKAIQKSIAPLFSNDRFLGSIKASTSDEGAVRTRIELFTAALDHLS